MISANINILIFIRIKKLLGLFMQNSSFLHLNLLKGHGCKYTDLFRIGLKNRIKNNISSALRAIPAYSQTLFTNRTE